MRAQITGAGGLCAACTHVNSALLTMIVFELHAKDLGTASGLKSLGEAVQRQAR